MPNDEEKELGVPGSSFYSWDTSTSRVGCRDIKIDHGKQTAAF
jgi:hypothetical protein